MRLTDHDLKQIDFQYLANLSFEELLNISFKFFQDLIESRDRLNQTPLNSSRPPASFPPWQTKSVAESSTVEESLPQGSERGYTGNTSASTVPTETVPALENERGKTTRQATTKQAEKKKPGLKIGSPRAWPSSRTSNH